MMNDVQKFMESIKGLSEEEVKQAQMVFMKQVIEKELRKAFAAQKVKNARNAKV